LIPRGQNRAKPRPKRKIPDHDSNRLLFLEAAFEHDLEAEVTAINAAKDKLRSGQTVLPTASS